MAGISLMLYLLFHSCMVYYTVYAIIVHRRLLQQKRKGEVSSFLKLVPFGNHIKIKKKLKPQIKNNRRKYGV